MIDHALLDNVEIPLGWKESLTSGVPQQCIPCFTGLIAGGKNAKEGRQTVFFTALPMSDEPEEYQRFVETTKGTLEEQLENPGCDLLDSSEKGSGQRLSILANPNSCHYPLRLSAC